MIFAALFIFFFSSSSDALGPILSDLSAMDGQVVQLGLTETQQEDLRKSLERVAAASTSQASTIETSRSVLRELVADHEASRVQLESALRAALDADRKQADAALDVYFDLRESLTAEQWLRLLGAD